MEIDESTMPVITKSMEDDFAVTDWKQLFAYYKKSPRFSDGPIFEIIFLLYEIWLVLAETSETHKRRMDEIKRFIEDGDCKDEDAEASVDSEDEALSEGQQAGQVVGTGKYQFIMAKTYSITDVMVECWKFMQELTMSIEIWDTRKPGGPEKKLKNILFIKRPPLYMLPEDVKNTYREECDISDTKKKISDMMLNYEYFSRTMLNELLLYQRRPMLNILVSRETFFHLRYFFFTVGLIQNIIICAYFEI